MPEFSWTLHPHAESLVDQLAGEAAAKSPRLAWLVERLRHDTSTGLRDWLDSVTAPVTEDELHAVGYVESEYPQLWRHPGAQLAAIVRAEHYEVALAVDDINAFAHAARRMMAIDEPLGLEGSVLSGYRRVEVSGGISGVDLGDDLVRISGIERRSWSQGMTPQRFDGVQAARAARAWEVISSRPRSMSGVEGVRAQIPAALEAAELVGQDLAASYFLQLERQYWQRHNAAGSMQHARQDRLGLGWGNNDHHTFRSSRTAFSSLIEFLTTLGFKPRERFHAGAEAGWGAQVLEHPGFGGVIFADVDLTEAEVDIDFSRTELADDVNYGTVGMWCALHGESLLGSGMHHLEGQFSFDALATSLADRGCNSMPPFSDFPHLRQAFTEAELWPVPGDRLARLVRAGQLTPQRAAEIGATGAAGSHLENLARRGGFKGFNQHNVSTTMLATHPRDYRPALAAS
jgi:hypothetical protein